jgi:uncharacterized coiled-coil DUF342 family protein
MAMARDAWTDERLDDLNGKVDRLDERMESGFAEIREEIRAGRAETREELKAGRGETRDELKAGRGETREELDYIRGDLGEIRSELGALNRTIHQFMFAIVGTIFLGFTGTISALITLT